jgi:hypothetical protein
VKATWTDEDGTEIRVIPVMASSAREAMLRATSHLDADPHALEVRQLEDGEPAASTLPVDG